MRCRRARGEYGQLLGASSQDEVKALRLEEVVIENIERGVYSALHSGVDKYDIKFKGI